LWLMASKAYGNSEGEMGAGHSAENGTAALCVAPMGADPSMKASILDHLADALGKANDGASAI